MDSGAQVSLGGQTYVVLRARLGLYLDLEIVRSRFDEAVKTADNGGMSRGLADYILLSIPEVKLEDIWAVPWHEIVVAYAVLVNLNSVNSDEFAMLSTKQKAGKNVPWDHAQRLKTVWIHSLASAYNWSKTEIENLVVEEAIGYSQEIHADEQIEREFQHSLSEVAYPYDQASKTQRYKPLTRPLWMVKRDRKELITKLDKRMLPVGKVVHEDSTETIEEIVH